MSPLAPQVKAALAKAATSQNGVEAEPRIIEPTPNVLETAPIVVNQSGQIKFIYKTSTLLALRHTDSEAPNFNNRNVPASITKTNISPDHFSSAFSFNIMSTTLNQMHNDRKFHRQAQRYPNGGRHGYNGDCHPQHYQGKHNLHDLYIFNYLTIFEVMFINYRFVCFIAFCLFNH